MILPEFDINIGDKITVILLFPYNLLCSSVSVVGYFVSPAQPLEVTVEGFVGDMVIGTDGNLYKLRPDEKDGPFYVLQRTTL